MGPAGITLIQLGDGTGLIQTQLTIATETAHDLSLAEQEQPNQTRGEGGGANLDWLPSKLKYQLLSNPADQLNGQ